MFGFSKAMFRHLGKMVQCMTLTHLKIKNNNFFVVFTLTKQALEVSIFLSRFPVIKHQIIKLGVPVNLPVLELQRFLKKKSHIN